MVKRAIRLGDDPIPNADLPEPGSAERQALADAFSAGREAARAEFAQVGLLGHQAQSYGTGPHHFPDSYESAFVPQSASHYFSHWAGNSGWPSANTGGVDHD